MNIILDTIKLEIFMPRNTNNSTNLGTFFGKMMMLLFPLLLSFVITNAKELVI